jgi:hypothetical protein
MHKNAMKCNKTQSKWCINKHGASKIIDTFETYHISLEWLKPTYCSFHGIVPGSANHPLGKIELDVCFGDSGNFCKEKLEFEVMDWPSQYHAILGRPTFAKFMAVPHYAYLALRIPGPKGVITI